jgi:hypothetical protein
VIDRHDAFRARFGDDDPHLVQVRGRQIPADRLVTV